MERDASQAIGLPLPYPMLEGSTPGTVYLSHNRYGVDCFSLSVLIFELTVSPTWTNLFYLIVAWVASSTFTANINVDAREVSYLQFNLHKVNWLMPAIQMVAVMPCHLYIQQFLGRREASTGQGCWSSGISWFPLLLFPVLNGWWWLAIQSTG